MGTRDDPDPNVSANATECLLNSITQYAIRHEMQLDGWILLYCYYKEFAYAPGYSYARWKLENLITKRSNLSTAPYSLWGIMLSFDPIFNSQHGDKVFQCFKTFVRLGLYEFAEVVFNDIQNQCSALDRYLINTQLSILQNKLKEDIELFNLPPTETAEDGGEEEEQVGFLSPTLFYYTYNFSFSLMKQQWDPQVAFTSQINGNVEYYRKNFEQAAAYYSQNTTVKIAARDYLVSRIRLAYLSFEVADYQLTIDALNFSYNGKLLPLTCNYLRGKAYYKMDDLAKAMECFIACTTYGIHMPDMWGFLALINLQLGNNLHALLCWKHARSVSTLNSLRRTDSHRLCLLILRLQDPAKRILDETIFTELDLIDVDSVEMYIDKVSIDSPNSPNSSEEDS